MSMAGCICEAGLDGLDRLDRFDGLDGLDGWRHLNEKSRRAEGDWGKRGDGETVKRRAIKAEGEKAGS